MTIRGYVRADRTRQVPPPLQPHEIERFWSRVRKTDSCWLWIGAQSDFGYGRTVLRRVCYRAHRIAYWLSSGTWVPPEMQVNNRCDVPQCVRPEHLFLGTQLENLADAISKARTTRGSKRKNSKLTEAQVLEIHSRLASGEPQSSIARAYGVSQSGISRIGSGLIWVPHGSVTTTAGPQKVRAEAK